MKIAKHYEHHRGARPLLRSSPWRTALFVTLNLALFAAANVFRTYLATGNWYDFTVQTYYFDLASPLGQALLYPLSVLTHPWMILIAGLLLAAALLAPIITAVLYPLVVALLFAVVVAVLGHAPLLAVALMLGCVITARTPLRSDAPFLAVLLGLLPVGLYLYFFGLSEAQTAQVLPLQRWVLAGPMLIAVVGAVLAAACVLALAKLTRFRAGVVFPVLAGLLAAPIALFYTQIGPAELDYRILAQGLATGDLIFQPVSLESRTRRQDVAGLNDQTLEIRLRDDLQHRQQQLIARCDLMLRQHPTSTRTASVLWLWAQCQSLTLDVPALRAGAVRCSAAFVSPVSVGSWRRLVEDYPRTPQAALAQYRLGQLALRQHDMVEADRRLAAAEEHLARYLTRQQQERADVESLVFRSPEPLPDIGYYTETLFKVRRTLWLLERNDVLNDPPAAEALAALLNENPLEADYFDRIGRLVKLYERTRLGDNLKLAAALTIDDPYARADMLMLLAEDELTDAAVEANYQLGMLTMQTARARALPLMPRLRKPAEYFQIVIAAPPNPWQELAREHLARLSLADDALAARQ